jgi:predicted RNase H-like HicB family nuclease
VRSRNWTEGNMFVSYAPELDIAACGETIDEAKKNLLEVIRINVDEMRMLGTLQAFLRDAGFIIGWRT